MPLPRVRRGHNALGGNVVWVLGPGGQRHYYAHLDRFAHVPVGQRIEPGTVLGYVGNTGTIYTLAYSNRQVVIKNSAIKKSHCINAMTLDHRCQNIFDLSNIF